MTTISLTSTILGDESAVSSDVSRLVVWTLAGENISAGQVVRLKQSVSGAVVEVYDYATLPDPDLPPYGVAIATVLSGAACPVAIAGMVPGSITGILGIGNVETATVSSSGAAVRNNTPTSDDWVIGIADEQGRLQLINPIRIGSFTVFGAGSPEGVVTAPVGYVYHRTDGGAGTALYVKEAGSGSTGWVAIGSISGGLGSANQVYTTNNAGAALQWRKLVNANIDAAAAIEITKLNFGNADEVVKTNTGGTALESGKIANANVDAAAAIATSKLVLSPAGGDVGKLAYASAVGAISYQGGAQSRDILTWDHPNSAWSVDAGPNRSVMEVRPLSGASYGLETGFAVGFDGTPSHPALASTNFQTQTLRTQFETGVAANDCAGLVSVMPIAWRGTGGLGGFFFWSRFSMNTATAATRCFVGLSEQGSMMCATDPSGVGNTIGVGYDDGDSNWFLIFVDSIGSVTKVNSTVAKNTTDVYELRMYCSPSDSSVYVSVYDFANGVPLFDAAYSTDLPAAGTFLYYHAGCGTSASAVAQKFIHYGSRIESFY